MKATSITLVGALLVGAASVGRAQAPIFPTPTRQPSLPGLPIIRSSPTPAPPPALTITANSPIYDFDKIALPMRIEHYPFDRLDINALPYQLGDFFKIPGITYAGPNPQRQPDGSITFSVFGYFSGRGSRVLLLLRAPSKFDSRTFTVSASVVKSSRTTYTITNTWALKNALNPVLVHGGIGQVCENVGSPLSPAVGLLEYNGKISFLGRSGPLGTSCTFGLHEFVVRSGQVSATWKVVKTGPGEQCTARPTGFTRGGVAIDDDGNFVGDAVSFSDSPTVQVDGVVFATGNTDPVTVLKPTTIQYTCPVTLGSDVRTIRFVLDKVTILAPPGRRFP